jgi:uncharacterized protein (DUF1501 family)
MLTIATLGRWRECTGIARRDFLHIGALSLGSFCLADLLSLRAADTSTAKFVRDKSIVLLYLSGGASHIETFDPKMSAPAEIRSATGEVPTCLPGVTFGGTFPLMAARADRLAVVRSFQHAVGDHEDAHVHVLTGGTDPTGKGQTGFSIGSATTRLRGTTHPRTGLPTYTVLTSDEVDGQYSNERQRFLDGSHAGTLGMAYGPLNRAVSAANDPSRPTASKTRGKQLATADGLTQNMTLHLAPDRFKDRLALLSQLDRINRTLDSSGQMDGIDRFNQQATRLVLGGAADAFDFRKENPRLIERYDTSHIQVGHKRFRPSMLGHQMLVARRLCEAGCGFVSVHSAGWDMHADGNNPGIVKGMEMLGRTMDKAVSAFLDDVADRGLSDRILLVITGDFGRTPRINNRGGRDHWSRLSTLAFAGGGLNMGQVIGQSAKNADQPASDPISPTHLMATVLHTLFDVPQLRLQPGIPRDLLRLIETGQPIRELA